MFQFETTEGRVQVFYFPVKYSSFHPEAALITYKELEVKRKKKNGRTKFACPQPGRAGTKKVKKISRKQPILIDNHNILARKWQTFTTR